MNDNFSKAEKLGRDKYRTDLESSPIHNDYYFTPSKYDKIDCFVTSYTPVMLSTYAVEIKNRNISSEEYAEEGYILELSKYNALMDAYRNSGYTPIYLNYFNDARIAWDVSTLKDVDSRVIWKDCTRTTAENYGDRVPKKVILLYPNEGRIRRYDVS